MSTAGHREPIAPPALRLVERLAAPAVIVLTLVLTSCSGETVRPLDPDDVVIPFEPIAADFEHVWNDASHPFTGAAVIDVDGDGTEELFVGGGQDQPDALLAFKDGALRRVDDRGLSSTTATHGATALDLDNDGDSDLVVARSDGVHLYENGGAAFTEKILDLMLEPDAVPFAVTSSDIDGDGHVDLYVSAFVAADAFRSAVFNDSVHAKANVMLRNNGDLTFTDVTRQTGTAALQNTFMSMFVDLNGDRMDDLVVAQNTGQVEIFANRGNLTFERVKNPSGFGFWMGVAAGDIDYDGDTDLFFSNIGNSIPGFLTTGDLREDQPHALEWLLLRNDGDFSFSDATASFGLTGFGFAWGAVFEDIDLDGRLDLLVAQNYIKWPVHRFRPLPGKVLLDRGSTAPDFRSAPELKLENRFFGQSPVVMDMNGDGRPDIVWLNMNGPLRAFVNRSTNHFVTIVLPDNHRSVGATITIETADGKLLNRRLLSGQGLMTDQSASVTVAIPGSAVPRRASVSFRNGDLFEIENPPIDTRIVLPDS